VCTWSNINEYYRDLEWRGLIYCTDIATYSVFRVIDTFSWWLPISRSDQDRRSPFAENDGPECKPDFVGGSSPLTDSRGPIVILLFLSALLSLYLIIGVVITRWLTEMAPARRTRASSFSFSSSSFFFLSQLGCSLPLVASSLHRSPFPFIP